MEGDQLYMIIACPFPSQKFPIMARLGIESFAHTPIPVILVDVIFFGVFWLFFEGNFLINHRELPS